MAQGVLGKDPFSGVLFAFRGKRGDLVRLLWWGGQGMVLHAKRLERGRSTWPTTVAGVAVLTPAKLSMLLEGELVEHDHLEPGELTRQGTALADRASPSSRFTAARP